MRKLFRQWVARFGVGLGVRVGVLEWGEVILG